MEEFAAVLVALGAIVGASFGAYVAFKLGRGAAREDRLGMHEMDSIIDTRDRLLDLARLGEAIASLEAHSVQQFAGALRSLRYARARNSLIADDRLVDLLSSVLPELLRTFPAVRDEVRLDLARLSNVVRESMFDQESAVLATGKPLEQTDGQARRLDAMLTEVADLQGRFRGWSRLRIGMAVWRRLTFGF